MGLGTSHNGISNGAPNGVSNGMNSEDGYVTLGRGNNDGNHDDTIVASTNGAQPSSDSAALATTTAAALEELHELLEEPVEEDLEMVRNLPPTFSNAYATFSR